MSPTYLFGSELLKVLKDAEVVPKMTQSVTLTADYDEFVTVEARIAISVEDLRAVVGLLRTDDEKAAEK